MVTQSEALAKSCTLPCRHAARLEPAALQGDVPALQGSWESICHDCNDQSVSLCTANLPGWAKPAWLATLALLTCVGLVSEPNIGYVACTAIPDTALSFCGIVVSILTLEML